MVLVDFVTALTRDRSRLLAGVLFRHAEPML